MATATARREATTFEKKTARTARIAEDICPESTCEAYKTILTAYRWRLIGMVPKKGEHGAKLQPKGAKNPKAGVTVFCKHQVTKAA